MGSVNDEDREVDALVCLTDEYSFGLFILTEPKHSMMRIFKSANEELIRSADLIYAERIRYGIVQSFSRFSPQRDGNIFVITRQKKQKMTVISLFTIVRRCRSLHWKCVLMTAQISLLTVYGRAILDGSKPWMGSSTI